MKRLIMAAFTVAAVVSLMARATSTGVAAGPPQERDFFGTVLSVGERFVLVNTERGPVEVPTSEDTIVRLPLKDGATPADLAEGDLVAVSLAEVDGQPVADMIVAIPGKTLYRHVPGQVVAASETQITVLPAGPWVGLITFARSRATKVRLHAGATQLAEGSFVVIVAARDPVTGELQPSALEIHVVQRPLGAEPPGGTADAGAAGEGSRAEIKGLFEGVDSDGNWVINATPVAIGPNTKIRDAVAVGQFVEVEALLRVDGSLLAREIEVKDRDGTVSGTTRLEAIFEGTDGLGKWTIGGMKVVVNETTDTDGLPYEGQLVRVRALLLADGTLLAREIENVGGRRGQRDNGSRVELEGTFQGVDEDGKWVVNGTKVAVDRLTQLEGTPAVGSQVEVEAVLQQDGSLLARKVEAEKGGARKPRREVEIRGVIEGIGDNSLEINGITISLSPLTEVEGGVQVGDFAEVEAILLGDGSLVAREVDGKGRLAPDDAPERSKVKIEGTVQKMNEDGTFVLDGITVAISALSEAKGELAEGASVTIEGTLLPDGSVLASELEAEGRSAATSGTKLKIEGTVTEVSLGADGNITSLAVDGQPIVVDLLTTVEGTLVPGSRVEVKGSISDGTIIAGSLHVEAEEPDEEKDASEFQIEGTVTEVLLDADGDLVSIAVDGQTIMVEPLTEVEDDLEVGSTVNVDGIVSEGTLLAREIEGDGEDGHGEDRDEEDDDEEDDDEKDDDATEKDGDDKEDD